ncbi:dihydrodipicolinate synthase family protein [Streptomyces zagrosensis]|uniref:4-hydroxy-tetrahydrodipicolinate synthase n=1 Tax=Streptomyces zagrosensis TaxID=1042984 RepID=A0A7W9QCS3_9ACTN|nr:dihydrodipicolinate synthase family protein [Streptomyces zagrosensis]MBB5936622.1 4-hydroxy-tetrahydrodipicolinate synthase [Streptomyces zagrosensis]
MTPTSSLRGIHASLITPFTAAGSVAVDALEELAHAVLDGGATGIVALGTTGEPATLDEGERRTVIDVCARVCGQRAATLIVGAGTNDTKGSVAALAELAAWPQVGAALVPVPYFTRPSEAGVLAHFSELAANSPVPLIAYHIPYRTGQALSMDALRTLARTPGVAGIKYATNGIDAEAIGLLGDLPPDFAFLAGDDLFVSPLLALGATGGILASAQLLPESFTELAAAWRTGQAQRARTLGHALARLSAAAFAGPNPTVIKGVLAAQGRIPTPDVRLPLLPARSDAVQTAMRWLADAAGRTHPADQSSENHPTPCVLR